LGRQAPILPVDLYRRPMFALSSLTALCSFAAQGLAFVALPFYFQTDLGLNAVQTGLLLTPWPVMTSNSHFDFVGWRRVFSSGGHQGKATVRAGLAAASRRR